MDQHERNAQRSELLRQLGEQVEALTSSSEWKRWLDVAARFHDYSFGNQMLIAAQRPDATKVAGYRTWQSLGRQVRKGERGIKIFAPMAVKDRDAEDDRASVKILFRVVHVFDIAQTDGDQLPEMEWPILATMPDAGLYDRMTAVCGALGLTVNFTGTSADGARGWYEPDIRRITIVDTYPIASQTRTLLHELAHSLDPGCHEHRGETTRAERELVAESAAYLAGKRLGLDMDECSTCYVASWGGQPKELERIAGRVLTVAATLEAAVAGETADAEVVAA
jgi:antirestriction protein ArdC